MEVKGWPPDFYVVGGAMNPYAWLVFARGISKSITARHRVNSAEGQNCKKTHWR
jgi:hypothetical protein